ncbi:MAG: hypothetical protein Q8J78_16590 [Moraxellaceae bacterium]|nr:hypothetical protein [Moraxellaceae bacterium]
MEAIPSREELIRKIDALCAAEETREQVAQWAFSILSSDGRVTDQVVWSVLEGLGAADLPSTDRPYLYSIEDFKEWRTRLVAAN